MDWMTLCISWVLRPFALMWALIATSVPVKSLVPGQETSPPGEVVNNSDLIGQEQRHVISAWGSMVTARQNEANETRDFGHILVLGSLAFPRHGRVMGWRVHISRTDIPVDFQIWRAETRDSFDFLKLIGHTGPVFVDVMGTSKLILKNMGLKDMPFRRTDFIGIGLESSSPISFSVTDDPHCHVYEGKIEGLLLTCANHRFRLVEDRCLVFSLQALVEWSSTDSIRKYLASSIERHIYVAKIRSTTLAFVYEKPDMCSEGSMLAPGDLPAGSDYEMPVYTMPCQESLLSTDDSHGVVTLNDFINVPIMEDVCLLVIMNLGDSELTSRYALRADVIVMDTGQDAPGQCADIGPLIDFQDGPFMASHIVKSMCYRDPADHIVTVCDRHLRIRVSHRGKMARLRIEYRVVSKAVTSCKITSPWFPRTGSRVSAIIAIIVISVVAIAIAIGVSKFAKRGAPLFRERATSPNGSELFTQEDMLYRTSLSLSTSPSTSWPGEQSSQTQEGHLLADIRPSMTSDVTSGGLSERIIDVPITDLQLSGGDAMRQEEDLLSPCSLTSSNDPSNASSLISISQIDAYRKDRIT